MRKTLKLTILTTFTLFSALLTSVRGSIGFGSPAADGPASGRTLYIQNCSRCHGSNGRAQTALGRKLEAADLTSDDVQDMDDAKMIRVIKNGRTGMPGFGKKLNAAQIASIANYVRGL